VTRAEPPFGVASRVLAMPPTIDPELDDLRSPTATQRSHMVDMQDDRRRQDHEYRASMTCMIRHYVARRAQVTEGHPHNADEGMVVKMSMLSWMTHSAPQTRQDDLKASGLSLYGSRTAFRRVQ
jgi:hypothetical protein